MVNIKIESIKYKFLIFNLIFTFFILFLPSILIKKNRIANGNPFSFISVLGTPFFILIILMIISSIVIFLLTGKNPLIKKIKLIYNYFVFQSILVIIFIKIRAFSFYYLQNELQTYRISIGTGLLIFILLFFYNILLIKPKFKKGNLFITIVVLLNLFIFIYFLKNDFFSSFSIFKEYITKKSKFFYELNTHIYLTIVSITIGTFTGFLLGIWAFKSAKVKGPILQIVGFFQTIPSLALFGILIIPLSLLSKKYTLLQNIGISGIGKTPALIALIIYSLLPIVRNTYTAFSNLDKNIIESAKGMGMNSLQLFSKIQFPLTLPIVLAGIKISAVQTIGNATLAALIGAGGLGVFVFQGLGQAASDLILLGALPITLLAIITDLLFSLLIYSVKKIYNL